MAVDRRVRLRPKDGARSMYYGPGSQAGGTTSGFRKSILDVALGKQSPNSWLSNRPFSDSSPTTPSFIEGTGIFQDVLDSIGIGAAVDRRDAAGIQEALDRKSTSDITYTFNGFTKIPSTSSVVSGIIDYAGGKTNKTVGDTGNSSGILEPLAQTDGLVFPYTPSVDIIQSVDYSSYDPVHTNQEINSYTRTKAPTIGITGKFTAQNSFEAQYCMAALHFCKTVSKMSFGQSNNPGTPPPVLLLSGYGTYALNDIPVIVTMCTFSYPDDVDYVRVLNSDTYVPAIFAITLSLTVQNSPNKLQTFSLEKFRSGQLLKGKGWL